jgi:hypothetical protein
MISKHLSCIGEPGLLCPSVGIWPVGEIHYPLKNELGKKPECFLDVEMD